MHCTVVTEPVHEGLQEFTAAGTTDTAKPTGVIALQVNAGMHELKGTAEYSPQENPELVDKATVSKPLQEGLEKENTAVPSDINANINAPHGSPEPVHKAAVPKSEVPGKSPSNKTEVPRKQLHEGLEQMLTKADTTKPSQVLDRCLAQA